MLLWYYVLVTVTVMIKYSTVEPIIKSVNGDLVHCNFVCKIPNYLYKCSQWD